MARMSGQRSYAPEDINFTKSGREGEDGSPWSKIDRLTPKNILLEAYNNPSTVKELSLALGIASPYMEEEVVLLVEATLLKRLGDGKYETDFIILSKEIQVQNFESIIETGDALAPLLLEQLETYTESIRNIGFHGSTMPTEDLYWLLLPWVVDFIVGSVKQSKAISRGYTNRPRGGS